MERKTLFPTVFPILTALAALLSFSCGDDSGPSMPKPDDDLSSDGGNGALSSLVEISAADDGTLEDLVACTMDNAGTYATIGQTSYICYGYQWRGLVGIFESMAELTACTENRQGGLALIKKDRKILECSNMQWGPYHVPARSYYDAEALPSCTKNRQWEYNYIESTGEFALCNKEMWQMLVDVQESAEDFLACTESRNNGMALVLRALDTTWKYSYDTTGTGKNMKIDTTKSVDSVTTADTTLMICSSQRWIVYREAVVDTTDTTATSSDDAKVDETLPNITGLQVSRWVGEGKRLLAWDAPSWNPALVGGLVIERDRNYSGWKVLDTLKGDEIRAGLWLDSALEVTNQMKYRYRLYTIPLDPESPNRSEYTDVVGTMALDEWGFVGGQFDVPNGFSGCWMHGNQQHITWSVQRMANAGGWVLQALGAQDTTIHVDSTMAGNLVGFGPNGNQWLTRAAWIDLDTLREDDNHYWINWPMFDGYRLYAYYLDEFSGVTSEYSPEIVFNTIIPCNPASYPVYEKGAAALKVDTAKTSVSWEPPSGFYDCQQIKMGGAYYPTDCASGPAAGAYSYCWTVEDEYGDAAPCWDLGLSNLTWDPSMPSEPKSYAVRGVVFDEAGTGIWGWTTSSWRH